MVYAMCINIYSYAYLYTGDIKYLRPAAYYVNNFIDHRLYLGKEDPWRFIGEANLQRSYFMQFIPYYLFAAARNGAEPEPAQLQSALIRVHNVEEFNGKKMYVFNARLAQKEDVPFTLRLKATRWEYSASNFVAEIGAPGLAPIRVSGKGTGRRDDAALLEFAVPADKALEYTLRIAAKDDFFIRIPLTENNADLKEVYLINKHIKDCYGWRYYFNIPEGVRSFRFGAEAQRTDIFDSNGKTVATDKGQEAEQVPVRWLECPVTGSRNGWSFVMEEYGAVYSIEFQPPMPPKPFYVAPTREKLFVPGW
jgi:hypothetical protein